MSTLKSTKMLAQKAWNKIVPEAFGKKIKIAPLRVVGVDEVQFCTMAQCMLH
jgi:hypothetical protein